MVRHLSLLRRVSTNGKDADDETEAMEKAMQKASKINWKAQAKGRDYSLVSGISPKGGPHLRGGLT